MSAAESAGSAGSAGSSDAPAEVDFAEVRTHFTALRGLDAAARAARLEALGATNAALRDEVASLLQHDDRSRTGSTAAMPDARGETSTTRSTGSAADRLDDIVPAAAAALIPAPDTDPDPTELGDYTILGRLGEGGMGIVYRAQQAHPDREVALKVLRPGAVSLQQASRFELEARVLGRLTHPGIAQIYEAGSFDRGAGPQPYLAMELVEGVPLDRAELGPRAGASTGRPAARQTARSVGRPAARPFARHLALMADICDAVHHAHQKGVIHRDLKPSNILVTTDGTPKVLDFGVARATDAELRTTTQTVAGQLIGTVPYMSPEQVSGDPDAVDLRTDVHALGVVLFELLTGDLPRDLRDVSLAEAARRLQDDPPPRLGTIDPRLRGDIETIVSTALERDPDRRYPSAAAMAGDLRRVLGDRPILAQPPTLTHQARLFARRHRAVVAGIGLAACGLVAATVVSTVFGVMAARAAEQAAYEQQVAERVNVHLEHMLRLPDAHRGGADVSVLELVDGVVRELDAADELPEVEATVRSSVGGTYLSLLRFEAAVEQLERATSLWRDLGVRDDRLAESLGRLGGALSESGRHTEAVAAYREAVELEASERGTATLDRRQSLATALARTRDRDAVAEATDMLDAIVAVRRSRGDGMSLAIALRGAAFAHERLGAGERAAELLKESIERTEAAKAAASAAADGAAADDAAPGGSPPLDDPILASTLLRLAAIELQLDGPDAARPRFAEAWALTRDARPVGSPDWMATAASYLRCLGEMGRDARDETITVLTDVAERLGTELGPDDFRTREAWGLLARRYESWGEPEQADAIRASRATSRGTRGTRGARETHETDGAGRSHPSGHEPPTPPAPE